MKKKVNNDDERLVLTGSSTVRFILLRGRARATQGYDYLTFADMLMIHNTQTQSEPSKLNYMLDINALRFINELLLLSDLQTMS